MVENPLDERRKSGRATIGDRARTHHSKRAAKGNLEVIRRNCPHCNHHKALKTITKIKCSRCKREHGGN